MLFISLLLFPFIWFIHNILFHCLVYLYLGIDIIALLLQSYWIGTDVIVQCFVYVAQMLLWPNVLTSIAQMLWCRGVLFNFQFWGGKQNFVPNMWQVIFAHIPVEGGVVDSNVDGLLDGSGNDISLPSYDLKVIHRCFVASYVVIIKYWWWCFKMFFVSFFKGSGRFPNVLIITLSPATFIPIYNIALLLDIFFILWEHQ